MDYNTAKLKARQMTAEALERNNWDPANSAQEGRWVILKLLLLIEELGEGRNYQRSDWVYKADLMLYG